jgi:hypothetical protein
VNMKNPISTGPYTFTANMTIMNYTYGITSNSSVIIVDGNPNNINSV